MWRDWLIGLMVCALVAGSANRAPLAQQAPQQGPEAAQPQRPPDFDPEAAAQIRWVDKETGEALFTGADLVRFDWERQLFELAPERRDGTPFPQLWVGQVRPFTVIVGDEPVYDGAFWSSVSSMGGGGPTIIDMKCTRTILEISAGYPRDWDGGEMRFSPRLQAALERAGLIAEINEPYRDLGGAAHTRDLTGGPVPLFVTYDDASFRIGNHARVAVDRWGPPQELENTQLEGHELAVAITLTANGGAFRSHVLLDGMSPQVLSRAPFGHTFHFYPWAPAADSKDTEAQPGRAQIAVTVMLRRRTYQGMEVIASWESPPHTTIILPPQAVSPAAAQ
jgi:hypothetical protein